MIGTKNIKAKDFFNDSVFCKLKSFNCLSNMILTKKRIMIQFQNVWMSNIETPRRHLRHEVTWFHQNFQQQWKISNDILADCVSFNFRFIMLNFFNSHYLNFWTFCSFTYACTGSNSYLSQFMIIPAAGLFRVLTKTELIQALESWSPQSRVTPKRP